MGDILPDVDIDIAVIRGPEFRLRGLVEIVAVSALHLVEGQVSFAGAFRTEYGVFVELEVADLHLVQRTVDLLPVQFLVIDPMLYVLCDTRHRDQLVGVERMVRRAEFRRVQSVVPLVGPSRLVRLVSRDFRYDEAVGNLNGPVEKDGGPHVYPALAQCRGGRRFAVLARAVAYLDADAEVSEPVTADVMRIMGEQLLVDVPFRDSFDEPVRAGLVPVCFFLLVGNGRMRILDRNGFEGYEMLGAERLKLNDRKAIVQQLAFALSVVSHRGRSLNSKISHAREEYRARKVRPASFLTAMGNAGPYVASRCRRSSDGRRGPELCGRCLSSQRSMPSLRLREQAPGLRFADSVPAVSWRRHAVLGGDGESGSPARVVRDVLR